MTQGIQRCRISTQRNIVPRYFFFQLVQEDCRAALKIRSLTFGNTHGISGNLFANSPAYSSALWSGTLNSLDGTAAERIPMQESTEEPVAGVSDRDRDTIPTSRFLRSSSAENSLYPMEGRKFRNTGHTNEDFTSRNFTLTGPHSRNVFVMEKKIQDRSLFLLKFPYGSFAMDQRSRDG